MTSVESDEGDAPEGGGAVPATRNPDRDFSTEEGWEPDVQALRELMKRGSVADIDDPKVAERVGRAIARAVFDPRKQYW